MTGGERREKDDIELVQEYLQGNLEAFRQFFQRYASEVLTLAYRILGNKQDAEDVVSDVFFELWERRDRYDERLSTPKGYLLMLTRSRAIDRYRSKVRKGTLLKQSSLTSEAESLTLSTSLPLTDQMVKSELEETAINALQQLEATQRRALELVYFQGMSHPQIAATLDLPLGTVKSHIRRGIARLRTLMDAKQSKGSS